MNRRSFFRKFAIGAAAIAVAPKIIAEVSKPETQLERGIRIHKELEKCLSSSEYFRKYFVGTDPAILGHMVVYGTGQSMNDFKWHEPNWLDKYKIIHIKARRHGFNLHQYPELNDEYSKFPLNK